MAFTLPKLPYANNALEPHITQETLEFHYGKHHAAYVSKLNAAIENTDLAEKSLEEIIKTSEGGLFNNAAQVYNHTFYWNGLSPTPKSAPTGSLLVAIESSWGSVDQFKKAFKDAALGNFASGWTWLVKNNDNTLEIINTDDAECPITQGLAPLLTLDVWEHAYYIDYRNDRGGYIDAFWNLVNWQFVEDNFNN